MPSSVSGRRKGSRTARANNKKSTNNAPTSSPAPMPAIAESAPAVAARILAARPGVGAVSSVQKTQSTPTPAGNEIAIVKNSAKPNVFDFLQDGESSSTSSDSDSDHEGLPALAESQPRPGNDHTRDGHSSYLVSPGSSFRASSPEQTFSVTSRDSTVTDIEPPTSPDGSPATAYLRLVNKHNLQKRAQTRSRLDAAHQRQTPPTDDEQSDYSAPEDYYLPEHMPYSRRRQQHQHQYQHQHQRPHPHSSPSRNSEGRYQKDKNKSQRQSSASPSLSSSSHEEGEQGAGPLVTTTETQRNNKLAKTGSNAESKLASGYALLASKLDSSSALSSGKTSSTHRLVPVYRRFEHVNHRILLYLQDEISQMEEELQMMDEYEAKHRAAIAEKEETEHLEPASRRMDVEAQRYSAFHARRLELVDRLTYKVNQYNDALCSYTKMRQLLPQASTKDVQTYRTWMNEHTPIAKSESRFLEHESDLVSLNNTPANNASDNSNNNSILYFIIGVMSAALLLPLLAY